MAGSHRSDDPDVDRAGWADVRGRLNHRPVSHRLRQPKWVWRILGWLVSAFLALFVGTLATIAGVAGGIFGVSAVGAFLVSIAVVMWQLLRVETFPNEERVQRSAESYYQDPDIIPGHGPESPTTPLHSVEARQHRQWRMREERRTRRQIRRGCTKRRSWRRRPKLAEVVDVAGDHGAGSVA